MKTLRNRLAGGRALGSGMVATATTLLLAALPVTAATTTPYTATGWVIGVPVPGIWHTNALGQVLVRGNVHLVRVESSDLRLAGQRLVLVDGAAQADGSVLLYGNCYQQVGTWDPARTNFTASGGLWEISYRGVMQTDNSLQLHLVGSGSGGTIEGLRLEEDLTRAACPGILDPTCPYQYTGTIKSAQVNTIEVVDSFDHPFTGPTWGNGTCFESNKQFYAVGDHFQPTHSIYDSYVFGGYTRAWTVPDGMTLEWRADLVSLDDNATNTAILAVGTDAGPGYAFHKARDFAFLLKWSSSFSMSMLWCERPPLALPNTNVVLALALSRVGPDLVITTRVLDKSDPSTVHYQHSVVDTPNADPTLNGSQFEASAGIGFQDLVTDAPEAPPTSFWALLGVFQNTDGSQPVPTAVWDNLEVRTSEIPPVGIERTVRLTWPASATINFAVEGASTVQGPWLPVEEPATSGMNQMTVPLSELMRFFRLRQAP